MSNLSLNRALLVIFGAYYCDRQCDFALQFLSELTGQSATDINWIVQAIYNTRRFHGDDFFVADEITWQAFFDKLALIRACDANMLDEYLLNLGIRKRTCFSLTNYLLGLDDNRKAPLLIA